MSNNHDKQQDFFILRTQEAIKACFVEIGVQKTEQFFNTSAENLELSLSIKTGTLTDKVNLQLKSMSGAAVLDNYGPNCRTIDITKAARILSNCVINCFHAQPNMYTSQFYDIPQQYLTDVIHLIESGFVTPERIDKALSSYRNANFDFKNKFSSVFTFVAKKLTDTHRDYEAYKFFLENGASTPDMERFFGVKKNFVQNLKKELNIPAQSSHKGKIYTEAELCEIWLYIEEQSKVINRFYDETPIPAETIIHLVKINPHGYTLNDIIEAIKDCIQYGDKENQMLNDCFVYEVNW